MSLELNPVAVGNAVVLRAIMDGGWSSRAELAHSVGKDPRNLPRDIGVLAKAGLIADAGGTALTLTDEGRAQLDAIARAEGQTTGSDLLPDERLVTHAQLRPDPDNPRKDFDSDEAEEGLDELRQSILLRGRLLQNLVVRADPDGLADYIVTTGNRRWHAIQQAIWDGDWPEDRLIRVVVREGDPQEQLLTAVSENMIRRNMSPIEEAQAFGKLMDVHGLKTIDIHHHTGLSQKVIQNRLKLLRLSDDDKARMYLPEDHPDHLGYKAALRQLTVAREPEPAPTLGQQVAEHGAAILSSGEPGSPEPSPTPNPAASLGKSLSDVEALILAEVVDKAEREPDDLHPDYTAALPHAMKSGVPHLIARGLLGTRQKGMTLLIRPLLHTSGLKEWLEDIGFNRDRDEVLSELAIRVQGIDNVINRQQCGVRYATAWLNLEGDPRNEVAAPAPAADDIALRTFKPDPSLTQAEIEDAYAATESAVRRLHEPEQPELIESSAEEKATRRRAEEDRAESYAAVSSITDFSQDIVEWWRAARQTERRSSLNFTPPVEGAATPGDELALQAFAALSAGDLVQAAALMAIIRRRYGAMGQVHIFGRLTVPSMTEALIRGRVERTGPAADNEPDPVEDFVEAELEDEEAAVDGAADLQTVLNTMALEPAVPIRKSITPDHIVCLEDGRKFKSLKRHLRTRYNLSPEEYRAKWGLPRDYPMVAPNYAKARADLARQMGLERADV